jgi:hypothetical protein
MEEKNPQAIYPYARAINSASIAVGCEFNGEIYIAVCKRRSEPMTMAGTVIRLDYPDGTKNPAGDADTELSSAAFRSLEQLFGLTPKDFPQLKTGALQLTPTRFISTSAKPRDANQPHAGNFQPNELHIGHDLCAFIGAVEELPALHGTDGKDSAGEIFDTKPTWMNIRNVEMVKGEGGEVYYQYIADDNERIPRDTKVLPDGGMDKVEELVKHARELPFKELFNGAEGFIKFYPVLARSNNTSIRSFDSLLNPINNFEHELEKFKKSGILNENYEPVTQTGKEAHDFYTFLSEKLIEINLEKKLGTEKGGWSR